MPQERPNIVIMLADNVGYGDLGCYGGGVLRGAPTPRLDKLASEGLRLTNFNVEAECTPSRSALLTGRLPIRSGTSAYFLPGQPGGLHPWEITMAEMLSGVGYSTVMYGKWHLGHTAGRLPTDQGFDEWWGFLLSSDSSMHPEAIGFDPEICTVQHLWEGKKGEQSTKLEVYDLQRRPFIEETITQKSVDYVKKHAQSEQPFFLYIPFSLPHAPALPHPDFKGKSGSGDFADVMIELDYRTGQVLDAIQEAGIEDNTIVIWISDNGPCAPWPWMGDSGPFHGELGTAYEGAIRTAGMIRWPGKVESGRVSNEMFAILDFFPTLANIVGGKVPTDRPIDGVDQTDFILGKQQKSNRESLLLFIHEDLMAVKWRKFKVHLKVAEEAGGEIKTLGDGRIFNLEMDLKERHNIAVYNTWIAEPVVQIVARYMASLSKYPNLMPGQTELPAEYKE
jgi:arylsulfatase A-like enzyme